MKPVTKRKLSKSIVDLYYRNNQKLYVTSYIVFNGKTDYYVEIVITDKSKNPFNKNSIWLFDIQTLSDFYESHIRGYDIIIKDYNKEDVYETSQVCKASYTPFYMNRVFTLKKFGNITEEDICKCVTYFLSKVINVHQIFNLDISVEYESDRKEV